MQRRILSFLRTLFLVSILGTAGFLSCLTAMRLAIRGNEVTVPNLEGQTLQQAASQLNAVELRLKVDGRRFDNQIPGDRIISQVPSPDSRLKKNRTVRIVVSLGAKRVQVPDLRGESLRVSQFSLLKKGLSLGMIAAVSFDGVEKDHIIAQDPSPQAQLAASPTVNVLISSGRRNREYLMPDLAGRNLEEVYKVIQNSGITLGKLDYQSTPGLVRGTILKQVPTAGQKLVEGSAIDLEVSK
ncbi:MAG TPA: PASTA domain-containing protein [Terriglobia bacterium]|nr:PASTA domain-containing protein [Terriglobia bacterium]